MSSSAALCFGPHKPCLSSSETHCLRIRFHAILHVGLRDLAILVTFFKTFQRWPARVYLSTQRHQLWQPHQPLLTPPPSPSLLANLPREYFILSSLRRVPLLLNHLGKHGTETSAYMALSTSVTPRIVHCVQDHLADKQHRSQGRTQCHCASCMSTNQGSRHRQAITSICHISQHAPRFTS